MTEYERGYKDGLATQIGEKIAPDLKRILLKYQKGDIDIYLKKIYEEPKKIKLRKSIIVKR